jgi:mRNA interferase YafQ
LLKIQPSTQFKKDIKKLSKSGSYKMNDLKKVINKLENEELLEQTIHRPHKLGSNWKGYMECHIGSISSDWILIYKIDKKQKVLKLARTGTHSELYG